MNLQSFISLLFTCWILSFSTAQVPLTRNNHLQSYAYSDPDSLIRLRSETPITAIVVKSASARSCYLLLSESRILIPRDADTEDPTYFYSLPNPLTEVTLSISGTSQFQVFLLTSGPAPVIETPGAGRSTQDNCEQTPEVVSQSTWRSGLPAPNYTRSFHEVFHNVVHHSAGSNTSTNYTQVVRDIYLFHTQVNGWSDIGYNYLIAQDGTLYAGRDPGNGSQDQVRGAHFCGSNSGTLGVCLLGNYETATPNSASLETLQHLLTYQLQNQGRSPFERYNHPLGNLQTVVGHRDGCSTLCPGENVYRLLSDMRTRVASSLDECNTPVPFAILADTTVIGVNEQLVLKAQGDYDEFTWILPEVNPFPVSGSTVTVSYQKPGTYDVTLIGSTRSSGDTLSLEDYIRVSLMGIEPLVFPNPVSVLEPLQIDFVQPITASSLHDINGRLISEWVNTDNQSAPDKPGIYILTLKSDSGTYTQRLIVR